MTDLATVAQVGLILQTQLDLADATATFLISWTSQMIRTYLDQEITAHAGDVELCTPTDGMVFLREQPVTAISKVETLDRRTGLWTVQDPTTYQASTRLGIVTPNTAGYYWPDYWPTDLESWRVTYDHGYATVPDDIAGVCANVAARLYATPVGIDLERNGMRQTKYSLVNDVFNPLELMTLGHYRDARTA